MNEPGQVGIGTHYKAFVSSIEGMFGLSIQLGSNARIIVIDQFNQPIKNIQLVITYTFNSIITTETINYDYNRPVNRTFPEETSITLTATAPNIYNVSNSYTIPIKGISTFILIVNRLSSNKLIQFRYQ